MNEIDDKAIVYSLNPANNISRPFYLRTHAGDLQIFYDVFWRSIYCIPREHFLNVKTIVDIGAHIGMASLFLKLRAPGSIVYAMEPDSKNYELLLKNLEEEIKNKTVVPIQAALSDQNTEIYLQRSELSYNSSISPTVTEFPVRGIDMGQLLKEYQIKTIDILKIDIEGSESLLFSRETPWLSRVKNILIEIHSDDTLKQFEKTVLRHHFQLKKCIAEHENIYWAFRPTPA